MTDTLLGKRLDLPVARVDAVKSRRHSRCGAQAGPFVVKYTRYFIEQVVRKRPYLKIELCAAVMANPLRIAVQPDGRVRYWGHVLLPDETETRILRVVTLEDGSTLHNAFIDRNFREDER